MIRPGTYDARIHDDRVKLDPRIMNGHKDLFTPWPAGEMYIAVDRVPEGKFLACASSMPDQATLFEQRMNLIERRLVREGTPQSELHHLRGAIAPQARIEFEKRPMHGAWIDLGWLCDEITLHDDHIWHAPFTPFVPGVEHYAELWSLRVYKRFHERIAFEVNTQNPALMKRALWIEQSGS